MRKLLGLLMMLLLVVSLAACNNSKEETEEAKTGEWVEPTDNTTFEEFLDENVNSFDSEKLDSLFGEEQQPKPEDILDIKIPNLSAKLSTSGEYDELPIVEGTSCVAWQEGTVIYAAATVEGQTETLKLDLADLVELADQAMEESYVKPSEAINMLLANSLGSRYDLDYFLDKIDFDLDDFKDKGKGVYELKLEAVADLIEEITEGEVKAEDVLAELELFDVLSVTFKYSNGKIRNISVNIETAEDEPDMKITASLDLSYGKDGVNGLAIDFSMTADQYAVDRQTDVTELTLKANVSAEALSVKFGMKVVGRSMTAVGGEIEFEAEADASKIKAELKVTSKGEPQGVVTVDLKLDDNWVSEGSVVVEQLIEGQEGKLTVTLAGGSNVKLPNIDKSEAMDLMDLMMGSANKEEVYPYY